MTKHLDPMGIIDIGSNSVRFVAYGGNARVPSHLFNEKISPALGRGVEETGALDDEAVERVLRALARFRQLAADMGLASVQTVATAAVRDASNGAEFLDAVKATGLDPVVIPGDEEAELAALGVISAIPGARGIVADLGGGSLELTRIADGEVGDRLSLPLGVLRIGGKKSAKALRETIAGAIAGRELAEHDDPQCLYLVGGSFRAIARLDLYEADHPLPIVHQHVLTPERLKNLDERHSRAELAAFRVAAHVGSNRIDAYPAARAVLDALVAVFAPDKVIVSTFGLREGLLYRALDPATQALDPLLEAALEVGELLGRFGDHGTTIDHWIEPLFPNDDDEARRLRLAACLLCDFAWNAHPDFRAERAVEMALHGNWVGIDAHGRAVLGQALSAAFASERGLPDGIVDLLSEDDMHRASAWGRAIRLAQRLSGGTESTLLRTALRCDGNELILKVPVEQTYLVGEMVEKRLSQLAKLMGRSSRVEPA